MRPPEIPELPWSFLQPLDGIGSVLELGNKRATRQKPYKIAFERLGIRHVSVDLNGADGSLQLDIRQPLNLGMFDVVTNFGTSEHVSEQEPAWRNMIEAVGANGILVSHTPLAGWNNHGIWYPSVEFYREFARSNGFVFERGPEVHVANAVRGNTLCCVRMRRQRQQPFQMPNLSLIRRVAMSDRFS